MPCKCRRSGANAVQMPSLRRQCHANAVAPAPMPLLRRQCRANAVAPAPMPLLRRQCRANAVGSAPMPLLRCQFRANAVAPAQFTHNTHDFHIHYQQQQHSNHFYCLSSRLYFSDSIIRLRRRCGPVLRLVLSMSAVARLKHRSVEAVDVDTLSS